MRTSRISTIEILETLSGYYGGGYVSNFNRFSKLYRVQIQADPTYRVTPESLNHIYVRTGEGMAPLAQFVQLTKTYGPQDMSRFNLYNSISVNGTPASGYSSGDALKAVQETAEKLLPANYAYEFGGISREESQTTNNVAIIFAICMVLIYLILCALYESLLIPFSIILSVPCGFLGSFLFAQILGLENNIYMQTGLIMLIGLLAKTAILQTEYAVQRRKAGMSLIQAAYVAAKDRLRPILMTVMAMNVDSCIHIIMYRQKLIRFTHISHTYHIVETQHFRTSAKMHLTHTPDILTDHHVTADQLKAFAFRFETNLILQIMHFTHYRIDMISFFLAFGSKCDEILFLSCRFGNG